MAALSLLIRKIVMNDYSSVLNSFSHVRKVLLKWKWFILGLRIKAEKERRRIVEFLWILQICLKMKNIRLDRNIYHYLPDLLVCCIRKKDLIPCIVICSTLLGKINIRSTLLFLNIKTKNLYISFHINHQNDMWF